MERSRVDPETLKRVHTYFLSIPTWNERVLIQMRIDYVHFVWDQCVELAKGIQDPSSPLRGLPIEMIVLIGKLLTQEKGIDYRALTPPIDMEAWSKNFLAQ